MDVLAAKLVRAEGEPPCTNHHVLLTPTSGEYAMGT
jgi:hypothetical protein